MHQGYTRAAAVTRSDTVDLALNFTPKAIWIGGATPSDVAAANVKIGQIGALKVTTVGGDVVVLTGVREGSVLPIVPRRIWATGSDFANADLFVLGD